jgi:hypothetical protein
MTIISHAGRIYNMTIRIKRLSGADPARAPPKIGKNMIFHTKYPKNVRASLRSAQIY